MLRFFPTALERTAAIDEWLERIAARPALARVREKDAITNAPSEIQSSRRKPDP
jgi:hypothetical protein